MELSIVIPTLGRAQLLARVLTRLEEQARGPEAFEVLVVADASESDLASIDAVLRGRALTARLLQATRPGASAARNVGWRVSRAPLILFLDDDILPEPPLVAEHLKWHRADPDAYTGVLGHIRWADDIRVTPFLRWLEHGIQFNFPAIRGADADWGFFYTANVSVKRELLDACDGFDETRLPFGYEDLDFALRAHQRGFRLHYNRQAVAEHFHPMDLEFWRRRVRRIAMAEAEFVRLHPEFRPYFYELFSSAAAAPRARGRGERLAALIPPWVPVLGPWTWRSADAVYRQALAEPFLESWREATRASSELPSGRDASHPSMNEKPRS